MSPRYLWDYNQCNIHTIIVPEGKKKKAEQFLKKCQKPTKFVKPMDSRDRANPKQDKLSEIHAKTHNQPSETQRQDKYLERG